MSDAVAPLELLRRARRVGFVFGGGSSRCAFEVGVVETLAELGVRASLTVGVSGGVWNAAAVAVGNEHRLRYYWRCFVRMPHIDLRNLLSEGSPFLYAQMHQRTFAEYVGAEALKAPDAAPLWVGVTRLSDLSPHLFRAQDFDDPLPLLLASNFLPPFYTRPPRLNGVRYGDGALSDNLPYEKAFEEGCDAVVLMNNKGISDGGLSRYPGNKVHRIPPELAPRMVIMRPRHRLPVSFTERRWSRLAPIMKIGRLRAREVLLGERHPETDARAEPPTHTRLLRKAYRLAGRRSRS